MTAEPRPLPPPRPGEGSWARWEALSWTTLDAQLAWGLPTVGLLISGSTEAHGPHLPLATDTIIGERMATLAAERLAQRGWLAYVLPPLSYAVTDWAGDFPGSLGLSDSTFRAVLHELIAKLRATGLDRIALCNAHLEPDNVATLRAITEDANTHGPGGVVFPDVTRRANAERLTAEFRSGSCHAGRYEGSLVLAARPELFDRAAAAALPELVVPIHERIRAGARSFRDCGMLDAYCGDPARASAEEGHATYQVLAELVVEAVLASA